MQTTVRSLTSKCATISADMIAHCEVLWTKCFPVVFHEIRYLIHELNSRLHLQLICNKNRKLMYLGCPWFGVLNNPTGQVRTRASLMPVVLPMMTRPWNLLLLFHLICCVSRKLKHLYCIKDSLLCLSMQDLTSFRPNQIVPNFSIGFHGHESVSDTSNLGWSFQQIQIQSLFLDNARRSNFISWPLY